MLNNIYNQSVTILNKLKRTDSSTNLDVWYKTVLTNVAWYEETERAIGASGVIIGTYKKVLIPFNDKYLPYSEWKKGNCETNFTVSTGDYIILGEVTETITASNVVQVMKSIDEHNVCLVKSVEVAHNRFKATVQVKIEGV